LSDGSCPSYIGRRDDRQSPSGDRPIRQSPPFFRAAVLAGLLLATAGCVRVGLPSAVTQTDSIHTGSIKASVTDAVDPSDWEVVRQTVASVDPARGTVRDLDWRNPQTGSYGTLEAKPAERRSGGICRAFSTTVADFRGVRAFSGEACRPVGGAWQLAGIVPDATTPL
jgi:surface antigen